MNPQQQNMYGQPQQQQLQSGWSPQVPPPVGAYNGNSQAMLSNQMAGMNLGPSSSPQYPPPSQQQQQQQQFAPPPKAMGAGLPPPPTSQMGGGQFQGFSPAGPPPQVRSPQNGPPSSAGFMNNNQPPPATSLYNNNAASPAVAQQGLPPPSAAGQLTNGTLNGPHMPPPLSSAQFPGRAPQAQPFTPPAPGLQPQMPPSNVQPPQGHLLPPQAPPSTNFASPQMATGPPPTNLQSPSMQRGPGPMPPLLPGQPPAFQQQQQQSPYAAQQQPGFGQMPPGPQPGPPGAFPNQYPPQPGGAVGGGYPSPYPQAQPPQQQRRLDPDQMPNPIQVMAENQRSNGGVFATNQPGLVPPLVTTKFTTQDQGQSGPRFIRSTMYSVPQTPEMMKQSAVPFALIISPLAHTQGEEYPPPIVDFGELGPIRCVRCKAYMSPCMQFIDAGRRFQCLLCNATTEVPTEYFQHLDHTGQRVDKYERPELVLGTYEFVATKDYCRNQTPPNPPALVFVIDVSYNNVKSGLVHLLCGEMKRILRNLPVDQGRDRSNMRVGFITYNNTVHFYNVKSSLAQPQMMVVGDVQEMFMPLLDGFLCDVEESEAVIDSLMEQIPKMFAETFETETILLPAIQAGLEALKASECTGKLLVFHSTLPVANAPGQLRNRDDRKLLGTEKEKTVLTPVSNVYNNLGQECVQAGCSVDLFVFNNSFIDLATIGQVPRLTGGEVYKYTYFQANIDGQRVINDIIKNISRPIAFDAFMRVRTSTGIRPTDFYGHFFMSNTTDMEIASIDAAKSIAVEIKHDDKLPRDENVYVQVALLYTSCSGQRRLRILNLSLKTCNQLADLFRSCDLDTLILYLAKQGLTKLMEHTPKAIKDGLVARAAQILACYRKNCASPTSAGQLILPECMKLLPLYVNCLLKNDAFSGGSDMTIDDRSFVIYFVQSMDLPTSVSFFYPRLIPIHDAKPEETSIPAPIRCTAEKMMDDGAYIIENGIYMFIWFGLALSPEFTQAVFGVPSAHQVDTDRNIIPVLENPLSKRVRGIIESIQNERYRCMRLTLVRQRDKLENVLRHFLVEDRGSDGAMCSYVDFLCHMHKEIRALLPS